MKMKRLCALLLFLLLMPSCASAGWLTLTPRRALPEWRTLTPRSASLPDPAQVLGGSATLYLTDYRYAQDWICDGYTYASPRDWDGFLSEYGALAERAGFSISQGVEDGMDVWHIQCKNGKRAMLVPQFRGSLLLLVEKGLAFDGAPTPAPTAAPTASPSPELIANDKPDHAEEKEDGVWIPDFVREDCPYCVDGRCPDCGGTGRFGGSDGIFCSIYCDICMGNGYIEVEQDVWVPFE